MPQCVAITKKGIRCANEAMRGAALCGPHTDRPPAAVVETARCTTDGSCGLTGPLTTRQATAAELEVERWIPTHPKFAGARCIDCEREVAVGEMAYWDPNAKRWLHVNCYERRLGAEPVASHPDQRPERFRRVDDARQDRQRGN